jgi:hypothetical protein
MTATFCAVNFKRVRRRAFDLPPRRKDSEYGWHMPDLLLVVVVLAGIYWQLTH